MASVAVPMDPVGDLARSIPEFARVTGLCLSNYGPANKMLVLRWNSGTDLECRGGSGQTYVISMAALRELDLSYTVPRVTLVHDPATPLPLKRLKCTLSYAIYDFLASAQLPSLEMAIIGGWVRVFPLDLLGAVASAPVLCLSNMTVTGDLATLVSPARTSLSIDRVMGVSMRALGEVLANAPQLTTLSLDSPWTILDVGDGLRHVTNLTVQYSGAPLQDVLMICSPNITTLRLVESALTTPDDDEALASFITGATRLEFISVEGYYGLSMTVEAVKTSRSLRTVSIRAQHADKLHDVMRHNPYLEWLHLGNLCSDDYYSVIKRQRRNRFWLYMWCAKLAFPGTAPCADIRYLIWKNYLA